MKQNEMALAARSLFVPSESEDGPSRGSEMSNVKNLGHIGNAYGASQTLGTSLLTFKRFTGMCLRKNTIIAPKERVRDERSEGAAPFEKDQRLGTRPG